MRRLKIDGTVKCIRAKKSMQKSIFPQKIQKNLCITTKSLYTNSNFKLNYLENYNDSEHAVKTKNAPFFMIFPNISFFHMGVTDWTGPLTNHSECEAEPNFGL